MCENDSLMHYGTPRHSGRYPWGSGENPYQRNATWLSNYRSQHAKGLTDKEIADGMGITLSELRRKRSVASAQANAEMVNSVRKLKEKGYSNVEIGRQLEINESSVRSYLKQIDNTRMDMAKTTANMLKKNVGEKKYIDIGTGIEKELGISRDKLDSAIQLLKEKGYEVHSVQLEQLTTPGQYTTVKVLCPPGTDVKDVRKAAYSGDIKSINEYSSDGGKTFNVLEPPKSLSSKRLMIRYNEEGGVDKDGVIELRPGVEDLSLGKSAYAQVRIAVDGTHYLKGMAVYNENMPKGVDVIFNTNKSVGTPMTKVLKSMKDDPENPFGALIKANGQHHYIDKDGNVQLGVVNKVKEEGDWDHYSKNLSSQFLSKQPLDLIKRQLGLAKAEKKSEYDDIMALTNPAIKKKLLIDFADGCDKAAEDLKAAALPRQSSKVILPVGSLKDTEVYAPTYKDGETLYLIRYPHAGTFEIPTLTVNNKNAEGRKLMGTNAIDAIGINSKVASRLSGADFDGDSVVVIPQSSKVKIKTSRQLDGLKGFDPSSAYPSYPGMKVMSDNLKQTEMGKVSNLITDMTLKGADPDELARAVKHSMVVIDAVKHELNYKQSAIDNDIAGLKKKYQSGGGVATIISRAGGEVRVNERKKTNSADTKYIDKETGKKIIVETGRSYINSKGVEVKNLSKVSRMSMVDDANKLSSGHPTEVAYAAYANAMKALANQARRSYLSTENTPINKTAKLTYANEVASLTSKLNIALKNAPKERQAQIVATSQVKLKRQANPEMTKEDVKKLKQRELSQARAKLGASKKEVYVDITDKEWEAIQAGAVSNAMLSKILNNTDTDKFKERAMPKQSTALSNSKITMLKSMSNSGYTTAEIAERLGISSSTVNKYLTS